MRPSPPEASEGGPTNGAPTAREGRKARPPKDTPKKRWRLGAPNFEQVPIFHDEGDQLPTRQKSSETRPSNLPAPKRRSASGTFHIETHAGRKRSSGDYASSSMCQPNAISGDPYHGGCSDDSHMKRPCRNSPTSADIRAYFDHGDAGSGSPSRSATFPMWGSTSYGIRPMPHRLLCAAMVSTCHWVLPNTDHGKEPIRQPLIRIRQEQSISHRSRRLGAVAMYRLHLAFVLRKLETPR